MLTIVLCILAVAGRSLAATSANTVAACLEYGLEGCKACENPGAKCYACAPGKTLNTDQTGCVDCDLNCKTCTGQGATTKCDECSEGYTLQTSGKCLACVSRCTECHVTQGTTTLCDDCMEMDGSTYYILSDDAKSCMACPSHCEDCVDNKDGTTGCTACADGYGVRPSDKTCVSCPLHCDTCAENVNGDQSCSVCADGFKVRSADPTAACLACPATCTKCDENQRASTEFAQCTECVGGNALSASFECLECTPSCAVCDTTSTCATCKPGFYLTSGTCTACPDSHCDTCLDDGAAVVCQACDEEFGIKTSVSCDGCPEFCTSCNSQGFCLACAAGYRTDNGICTSCDAFCDVCNAFTCTGCSSGYAFSGSTCLACPAGCSDTFCDYSAPLTRTICTACDTSVTPQTPNDDGACVGCPSNCDACTWNSTLLATECSSCAVGYGMDADPTAPCIACTQCDYCVYNAIISAMDCTCPDLTPPALADERGFCGLSDVCAEQFLFDENAGPSGEDVCTACVTGPGCLTCNSTGLCVTCDTSGTRGIPYAGPTSLGACIACINSCTACELDIPETGTLCLTDSCDPGYGHPTERTTCQPCGGLGCSLCDINADSSQTCRTCVAGHVLNTDVTSACAACPARCSTCTYANSATSCASNGCDAGSVYYDTDKTCPMCPDHCDRCSVDGLGVTTCLSDGCALGYAYNSATLLCESCPAHCGLCSYDGALQAITCSSNLNCDNGYGTKADKLCYACPRNCDRCTLVAAVLECDSCNSGFYANDGQCGACPPDCHTCEYLDGTMDCKGCDEGFVLRSGVCEPCTLHCEECDLNGCKDCERGYGVSTTGTCEDCSILTFDKCVKCTDAVVGNATCLRCDTGFVLSDDLKACIDASSLGTCALALDLPWTCTSCDRGTLFDFRAIHAYMEGHDEMDGEHVDGEGMDGEHGAGGDPQGPPHEHDDDEEEGDDLHLRPPPSLPQLDVDGPRGPPAVCSMECLVCNATTSDPTKNECNGGNGSYPYIPCPGACAAYLKEVGGLQTVVRGCASKPGCADEDKKCNETGFEIACHRCCIGDMCNDFIMSHAPGVVASSIFLAILCLAMSTLF